jgi:hypothetical protein
MQLQDFYPIVVTEQLASCRDFYWRWFGLEIAFEASWFVLLSAGAGRKASLAFMHPAHPSAPPGPEPFSGKGMCLEFQVPDAVPTAPGGGQRPSLAPDVTLTGPKEGATASGGRSCCLSSKTAVRRC